MADKASLETVAAGNNRRAAKTTEADSGRVVWSTQFSQIIDDFNDCDRDEYTITAQDGTIQIVQSPVYEGACAIEVSSDAGTSRIQSTTGLNTYPEQGDTISAKHRFNNLNSLGGLMFGVQSETTSTNFYDFLILPARDEIRIRKDRTSQASTTVNFTSDDTDVWLDLTVKWESDGTITGTLVDADNVDRGSVTYTDTEYTSGGVGYRQNADSTSSVRSYWDLIEIVA